MGSLTPSTVIQALMEDRLSKAFKLEHQFPLSVMPGVFCCFNATSGACRNPGLRLSTSQARPGEAIWFEHRVEVFKV